MHTYIQMNMCVCMYLYRARACASTTSYAQSQSILPSGTRIRISRGASRRILEWHGAEAASCSKRYTF